ncbi:MAG TPA: DUF488 domain-containing protein [Cytophagales bacterium]|nr:DUF488 domain-containing protein [Cytophagales bacterium]
MVIYFKNVPAWESKGIKGMLGKFTTLSGKNIRRQSIKMKGKKASDIGIEIKHSTMELSKANNLLIWTIGHSTKDFIEFIDLLKINDIQMLVDVRNFPGSRRYPHYNKDFLENALPEAGIRYTHLKALGGRRKPNPGSINDAWRNDAFKGYADYMEGEAFQHAITELQQIALSMNTVYMCSEAVWWRCHRSLISDYLKVRGWKVLHILSPTKVEEHPYTSAARIVSGELTYGKLD